MVQNKMREGRRGKAFSHSGEGECTAVDCMSIHTIIFAGLSSSLGRAILGKLFGWIIHSNRRLRLRWR